MWLTEQEIKEYRQEFESGLVDTMTVSKYEERVNEYGATIGKDWVKKYENIPCNISFSTMNNDNPNRFSKDNNPILWRPKVFTKWDIDIKAGDLVEIKTENLSKKTIYKGKASDIQTFPTHIEFNIGIDEEA